MEIKYANKQKKGAKIIKSCAIFGLIITLHLMHSLDVCNNILYPLPLDVCGRNDKEV